MRHSDSAVEEANRRFERLADALDVEAARVESTEDLRAIADAADAGRVLDAKLREAVRTARAGGKSWNRIALALGVSRQAARQRFTEKQHA